MVAIQQIRQGEVETGESHRIWYGEKKQNKNKGEGKKGGIDDFNQGPPMSERVAFRQDINARIAHDQDPVVVTQPELLLYRVN
jgi:hypothetical protein